MSSGGRNGSGDDARDDDVQRRYAEQGFADQRIGFGERPALLIIDMQNDFVDPTAPSTCSPIAQDTLPALRRLLDGARAAGIPIFFSQGIVARDLSDVGLWKGRAHREGKVQIEGSRGAEIVDELRPLPGEYVIKKRRPSVFFATDLEVLLRGYEVDTLMLAGSSMSGCVRATAVDSFSRDIRTMVIRECVVDRTQSLIDRNLFDVDAKYADAVSLEETIAYLATRTKGGSSPRTTTAGNLSGGNQ